MTFEEAQADIARMREWNDARDNKYRRNYNRYIQNGLRREDIRRMYGSPLAWYGVGDDTGSIPIINATRSCIESQISKLSQTKVRPFLNPTSGTFRTRKVCRAGQRYFDQYYDIAGIYRKGIEATRDALIFEAGWLWADEETRTISCVKPWTVYFDPAELHYGRVTRCALIRDDYPAEYLRDRLKEKLPAVLEALEQNLALKVIYAIHWDFRDKVKRHIVNGFDAGEVKIEYTRWPFASIWYSPPVTGGKSVSLIDQTFPLQLELDDIVERIHKAAAVNPGLMIFTPQGSGIKPSKVSNEYGAIYEYKPMPDQSGGAISVATPRFIDPQYFQAADFYERKIYEMTGTSQLSAQAKKPAGADSGKALQTLEDVESDRHNVILQSLIRLYMDVASLIIDIFPEDEDILPNSGMKNVTWKDLKKERSAFRIQFSATSALSKDPAVKLEQIDKMIEMGMIKPETSAALMEMPDLEDAYSIMTAAYDDVQRIIERVIDTGKMDYYEGVPIQMLLLEATNTLLRLDANDEDPKVLENLKAFVTHITKQLEILEQARQPPAPPAAIPGEPVAPADAMAAPVPAQPAPVAAPMIPPAPAVPVA